MVAKAIPKAVQVVGKTGMVAKVENRYPRVALIWAFVAIVVDAMNGATKGVNAEMVVRSYKPCSRTLRLPQPQQCHGVQTVLQQIPQ